MNPLAATAISIVLPYLVKGGEEFAKEAGKAAFGTVKILFDRLGKWWTTDPVASVVVSDMPNAPERNSKFLADMLSAALDKDTSFASDIKKLIEGVGPNIDVIQEIEIANGVTGANIKKLLSGMVKVEQNIKDASNTTGFNADEVGR